MDTLNTETSVGRFNKEQVEEFKKASQYLIDYINKYGCPHDTVMVGMGYAEFLSGEMCATYPVPD